MPSIPRLPSFQVSADYFSVSDNFSTHMCILLAFFTNSSSGKHLGHGVVAEDMVGVHVGRARKLFAIQWLQHENEFSLTGPGHSL